MDLRLDCAGFASIQKAPENCEYVCPYSGEFIDEGKLCLVLKEEENPDIEGVWFTLDHLDSFIKDVCMYFAEGVETKKRQGTYDIFKMTEAVRFGAWEPKQNCLVCGDVVGSDEMSVYFLGLNREGFEFIHYEEECIRGFKELIDSVDQYSTEICSVKV